MQVNTIEPDLQPAELLLDVKHPTMVSGAEPLAVGLSKADVNERLAI